MAAARAARNIAAQVQANLGDTPTTLPAWVSLQAALKAWPGACSFCYYATGDPKAAATCLERQCPSSAAAFNLYGGDEDVVCFDNYKEKRDRLCILRDFELGRQNIEAMPPQERQATVRRLLEGALRDAAWRGADVPEMACMNPAKHATVPWTHVHLFKKGLNPDGGVEDHAYCSELRDAPAAAGGEA